MKKFHERAATVVLVRQLVDGRFWIVDSRGFTWPTNAQLFVLQVLVTRTERSLPLMWTVSGLPTTRTVTGRTFRQNPAGHRIYHWGASPSSCLVILSSGPLRNYRQKQSTSNRVTSLIAQREQKLHFCL